MSENLVNEMLAYQQSLCDSLVVENEKFATIGQQQQMHVAVSDLEKYLRKLRHLQKEMSNLSEQSFQLRKRAQRLQEWRQQEDEQFAFELERVKQMEQSLKPVVKGGGGVSNN